MKPRRRADVFRYLDFDLDTSTGELVCRYSLDDLRFDERIVVGPPAHGTHDPASGTALLEAARLIPLLAGISYYKAGAAAAIDLGDLPVRDGERAFLREYYVQGLGEFAYANDLVIEPELVGGGEPSGPAPFQTVSRH